MMGQRCEFVGCKETATAPVTFANGETNWFCKACHGWITGVERKIGNSPDANAGDPAKED